MHGRTTVKKYNHIMKIEIAAVKSGPNTLFRYVLLVLIGAGLLFFGLTRSTENSLFNVLFGAGIFIGGSCGVISRMKNRKRSKK